jgi:hypothetical protein
MFDTIHYLRSADLSIFLSQIYNVFCIENLHMGRSRIKHCVLHGIFFELFESLNSNIFKVFKAGYMEPVLQLSVQVVPLTTYFSGYYKLQITSLASYLQFVMQMLYYFFYKNMVIPPLASGT